MVVITRKLQKRYLKHKGRNCVFCGALLISRPIITPIDSLNNGKFYRFVRCDECKKSWRDIYALKGAEIIV